MFIKVYIIFLQYDIQSHWLYDFICLKKVDEWVPIITVGQFNHQKHLLLNVSSLSTSEENSQGKKTVHIW